MGYSGLGQDVVHIYSTLGDQYSVKKFPFQYSDPVLRQGLPTLTTGLIGLGRTVLSLQAQLASAFKIHQHFTLCLPSSSNDGNMIIGQAQGGYNNLSIRVGNKTLSLNKTLLSIDKNTGEGGTSIRTVRAYTNLHRSIYRALIKEFVKAATAKDIKRVASVAPFGACFDSKTVGSSKTGADVPIIDLVLQTKNVFLEILWVKLDDS
ncbi:hypothetical protein BUALT_Bualt04G0059700 [Buddleja alternifolia]|uniref:Xylanase inhibitor N-terminal domain-containing protein n=1 Tax=Buddleja alternifolia TaxID=168488 RepID=A0AAV6XT61_9LAMI|nr:hypothetical protein BUALT_Bualt04G0059700 [Buddleja alternifolia]